MNRRLLPAFALYAAACVKNPTSTPPSPEPPPAKPISDDERFAYLAQHGARNVTGGEIQWGAEVSVEGFAYNSQYGAAVGRGGPLVYCSGRSAWPDEYLGRFVQATGHLVHRVGFGDLLPHAAYGDRHWTEFVEERVEMSLDQCSVALGFPLSEVPEEDVASMATCPGMPTLSDGGPAPRADVRGIARTIYGRTVLECNGLFIFIRCASSPEWPESAVGREVSVKGEVYYRPPTRIIPPDWGLPVSGTLRGHFGVLGCSADPSSE